ncbi:MAG: DUF350 domain-containing protein [Anaerolineae bacterium]|nr:DUF350 domain-containing protein [Anaerolineae bacterium]MDW8071999.1 DUF350 domain-containing protein [Anaerolineae bacterium]
MAHLVLSIAQIGVAIIMTVIATYLGVVLFNRATRHLDEWAELRRGNVAMGLVAASIIVGIAVILRPALTVPPAADAGPQLYPIYALLTQAAGLVVGLILALSGILLAVALFDLLTGEIDELAELQKGNVAIAALLAAIVLAVSWLMSNAIQSIMVWLSDLILRV